jgi:hypothetical protein
MDIVISLAIVVGGFLFFIGCLYLFVRFIKYAWHR